LSGKGQAEVAIAWDGDVDWRTTSRLREDLLDGMEVPGQSGVRLDVRGVRSIDRCGIALLIGANFRASAVGRHLVLVDAQGPVIRALEGRHILGEFEVNEVTFAGRDQVARGGPE
jgi:anti-anti-sigma factor